jgi:predicted nucleic acid-binding protein
MNTQKESLAYPDGVLDASVIVPACFENPLKVHSIEFISEVMLQKRRVALPIPAVMGAYHIATRYLRVSKIDVKKVMEGILRSGSPALYPYIAPGIAADCLDYAIVYDIESWDGYIISLARSMGSTIIYSLDEELSNVKEITIVNPFPQDKVKQYRDFLERGFRER